MGSIFFFLSWRLTSSLSLIQKGTISITTFIVFFLLWSPTSVSFLHLFSSPLIVTIIITCNSIFFCNAIPTVASFLLHYHHQMCFLPCVCVLLPFSSVITIFTFFSTAPSAPHHLALLLSKLQY